MTETEKKNYLDFMYNEDNIHNCECCPENRGFSDWQRRYPCGQSKCWVEVHTEED